MLVSKARNFLKEPAWEIQKTYYQTLYHHQRSFEERQCEIDRLLKKIDFFSNFERSVVQLTSRVETMDI
jgi:hypothetical protein